MTPSSEEPDAKSHKPHETPFFVDGEQYRTSEDELAVAAVLALAGKQADEWYLVEKHGRDQTEYRAGQSIAIKSGAKFLTVFTGPTPVS